jgi:hypothetical protein
VTLAAISAHDCALWAQPPEYGYADCEPTLRKLTALCHRLHLNRRAEKQSPGGASRPETQMMPLRLSDGQCPASAGRSHSFTISGCQNSSVAINPIQARLMTETSFTLRARADRTTANGHENPQIVKERRGRQHEHPGEDYRQAAKNSRRGRCVVGLVGLWR